MYSPNGPDPSPRRAASGREPSSGAGSPSGSAEGIRRRLAGRAGLQGGDERLLRHLHAPDHLHALLAFLLLLQQLALAADVTAVALGQHVLADRADVFASDDACTDGRLDGHLELLAGN